MKFYRYKDDIVYIESEIPDKGNEILVKSVSKMNIYLTNRDELYEYVLDRGSHQLLLNTMILNNYEHLSAIDTKCTPYVSWLCNRTTIKDKEYIIIKEEYGCDENYELFLYKVEDNIVSIRSRERAKHFYHELKSCVTEEDFEQLRCAIDDDCNSFLLTIEDRNNLYEIVNIRESEMVNNTLLQPSSKEWLYQ